MATVVHALFSWVGADGSDFAPGAVHGWWMVGYSYGDALSVTAHPVTGNPEDLHRVLEVTDVVVDGDPSGGLTLRFAVTNVGTTSIPAYGVGIGLITG